MKICRDSGPGGYDSEKENCELSDRDTRDLEIDNPQYFDTTGNYDFYERSSGRQSLEECLDGRMNTSFNCTTILTIM